jgi:hypothetical protein
MAHDLKYRDGSLQFTQNGKKYCVTFQKTYTPGHPLKWEQCTHASNQQLAVWWIDHRSEMRKTNEARVAHWITKDGIRKVNDHKSSKIQALTTTALAEVSSERGIITENPFLIVSKANNHQHLMMSNEKVGADRVLKLSRENPTWRSLFIYDKRTKSIRLHSRRQRGQG